MIDLFNKNKWREPILKHDLLRVLEYGFLISILVGLIAGLLDYATSLINMPISFGLFIIAFGIGYSVRRSYTIYHVLYSLVTIPLVFIALFFCQLAYYLLVLGFQNFFVIFTLPEFYLSIVLLPVSTFIAGIKNANAGYIILGILNFFIYISAYILAYMSSKGRRY